MTEEDIDFVLSGGANNTDPNLSLGGEPSSSSIGANINNLFDDVDRATTFTGGTDYRCFYVVNKSITEKLKSAQVFVKKTAGYGADISMGLDNSNEVQVISIAGQPIGGSFRLSYIQKSANGIKKDTTRDINWVPDALFMAQRIAALINSLGNLTGVTCLGQQSSSSYDFVVTFSGTGEGRKQELLEVEHTNGLNISIYEVKAGGPINTVATNIGQSNNAPNGITFVSASRRESVKVGTLLPGDYFAVWIKREVPRNTSADHPDRFGFKIFGDAIDINQQTWSIDSSR